MPTALARTCWTWLLLAVLAVPAAGAAQGGDQLARIQRLADAGATELALKLLDEGQAQVADPAQWARWERARVEFLVQAERWRELLSRTDALPAQLPSEFVQWARTQEAQAALALNDGARAVRILRRLIWTDGRQADELAEWRRMLVRAYLSAGLAQDAAKAVLRYEQDYEPTDLAWRRLRARVLLANDRPQEARALLGEDAGGEARALYLLAALRSAAMTPAQAARQAEAAAQKKNLPRAVQAELWAVAAVALAAEGAHEQRLAALANAVAAGGSSGLLVADGARLWQAFREYGRVLGNQRQLLTGDDRDWLQAAEQVAAKHPLQACALYSVVTETGSSAAQRTAHAKLAALLEAQPHGIALLRAMYLQKNGVAQVADLPAPVCHRLADVALADSDFALASRLMGNLSEPPQGVDQWFWQLRRARVLILGGDYDGGADALQRLLAGGEPLSRERLDRLMQVLFDLQRVGAHKRALQLFSQLPLADQDVELRREVLYWRADSHKALGQYAQAAQLYLESAWLPGQTADQWSQTAQYQAADALRQAGMTHDARRIYNRLLAITADPGRRAVLRSRMQQLSLSEGQQTQADADARHP